MELPYLSLVEMDGLGWFFAIDQEGLLSGMFSFTFDFLGKECVNNSRT